MFLGIVEAVAPAFSAATHDVAGWECIPVELKVRLVVMALSVRCVMACTCRSIRWPLVQPLRKLLLYGSSKSHGGMRDLFLFLSVLLRLGKSSAMHALHMCNLGEKRATLSSRSSRTHRMLRKSTEVCCPRGGKREPIAWGIRQPFCWC